MINITNCILTIVLISCTLTIPSYLTMDEVQDNHPMDNLIETIDWAGNITYNETHLFNESQRDTAVAYLEYMKEEDMVGKAIEMFENNQTLNDYYKKD